MLKRKKIGLFCLLCFFSVVVSSLVFADVLTIIEQHFALTQVQQPSPTSKRGGYTSDLRFVFEESEDFLETDLRQLLNTLDRSRALNTYIADGDSLDQFLAYHYNRHMTQLQLAQARLATCKAQLSSANTTYQSAIQQNQSVSYETSLLQAKSARSCMGSESVTINALQQLNTRITFYRSAIQRRTATLKNYRTLIINNYELLDARKLAELQRVTSVIDTTSR